MKFKTIIINSELVQDWKELIDSLDEKGILWVLLEDLNSIESFRF